MPCYSGPEPQAPMALLLQPGYSRNLRAAHCVSFLDVRPSFMLTNMSKHTEFCTCQCDCRKGGLLFRDRARDSGMTSPLSKRLCCGESVKCGLLYVLYVKHVNDRVSTSRQTSRQASMGQCLSERSLAMRWRAGRVSSFVRSSRPRS